MPSACTLVRGQPYAAVNASRDPTSLKRRISGSNQVRAMKFMSIASRPCQACRVRIGTRKPAVAATAPSYDEDETALGNRPADKAKSIVQSVAGALVAWVTRAQLWQAAVLLIGAVAVWLWRSVTGPFKNPSTYWHDKTGIKKHRDVSGVQDLPKHMPAPRAKKDIQGIIPDDAAADEAAMQAEAVTAQLESKDAKELAVLVMELVNRVELLEASTSRLHDRTETQLRSVEKAILDKPDALKASEAGADGDKNALQKAQEDLVGFISTGYLETMSQVREQLMLREWELDQKLQAKVRGVAAFEKEVAGKDNMTVSYAVLSKLYADPDSLEVIEDERLRSLCRSHIVEALHNARTSAWNNCTKEAKELTDFVRQGDVFKELLPTSALQNAAKAAVKAVSPVPLPGL